MFISINKNVILISLYLIPLLLIIGTSIANLGISLAAFSFIILTLYEKKWKYYNSLFFKLFILWWSLLIISSLLSEDLIFSLSSSLFYLRFGLLTLSIWYILDHQKEFIKYFTAILSITFLLVIADSYIQYFSGSNLMGIEYTKGRLSSFFGDELIVGNYLSRLYPLLIGLVFLNYYKNNYYLIFIVFSLVAIDLIIYLSGERVAFLNLIILTFLIILLVEKWKKIRILTFLVTILMILFVTLTNQNVKTRMYDHTLDQISNSGKIHIFSEEHENFYIASIKMFSDYPFFGIGPKMYRVVCEDERYYYKSKNTNLHTCSTSPHGIYPQLLAETGAIGTTFVFGFFIYIIFLFTKHICLKFRSISFLNDYQICLLVSLFISLWPIIPAGNFFGSWISIIYYLPLGFLIHSFTNTEEK